jgi:XRE family aerobic/anaerobic benzoate catabolism transcriptional regulator
MTAGTDDSPLLRELARRVRELRRRRGWPRSTLAERSGLSVRFLARVEGGEGNISIVRLEALARALGTTPDQLIRPPGVTAPVVALVGMRGAGKSTVGPLLARRLGHRFIEVDERITGTTGLPLDQLFELHGEAYYRRLERETLRLALAGDEPTVLAAAGGVVNDAVSWDMLCDQATVVWLRASPEDHWNRVVAQGDRRPMADNPDAMEELRAMLRAREAAYRRARHTIDTSGRTAIEVADAVHVTLVESGYPARTA